jgi:hypothetical protein
VRQRWFVSRQDYWGEENPLAVEIAAGGVEYANADMLVDAYAALGEGREYDDPREAAAAAIAVAEAWRRDTGRSAEEITVRVGYTGGMTMPFEEGTDADAREWAERTYAELPKCPHCGELMGNERWVPTDFPVDDDEACCSQFCCEARHLQEPAPV